MRVPRRCASSSGTERSGPSSPNGSRRTRSCYARWSKNRQPSTRRRKTSRRVIVRRRADQAHPRINAMTAPTLLGVNNVEVIYDHVILVLRGVSLSVPEGGVVALLGANGAGKTTTLKAISNLL